LAVSGLLTGERGERGVCWLGLVHTLDDQRSEVRDTPVGHVAHSTEQEEKVELDIREGLDDLIPLFSNVRLKTTGNLEQATLTFKCLFSTPVWLPFSL